MLGPHSVSHGGVFSLSLASRTFVFPAFTFSLFYSTLISIMVMNPFVR